MRKTSLTLSAITLALAASTTSAIASECKGELYGINSGRGDMGLLFQLGAQGESTQAHSIAEFSSAALAYDSTSDRIYYISAPRPFEYKVDISHLNLSSSDKKDLPIAGNRFKYTKLAYFDVKANAHVEVGKTKSAITMVYDTESDSLLASDFSALYQINKQTGEATKLADLDSLSGKYRGDLVIKDGALLLITSSTVYNIDRETYALTKLSKHGLTTVTGATLDQNNHVIISRTMINDQGHLNKSQLYKLNPESGNTCFISEVPVRLNDLTTNTNQTTACITTPSCETDPIPTVSLAPVVNSVLEGGQLEYTLSLSASYYQDVTVELQAIDVTTTPDDYNFETQTVTFSAGETELSVVINTNDNDVYSESKEFTLQATAQQNAEGSSTAPATILNDDIQCTPVLHTQINYQFISESAGYDNDWGVVINGQFIKLLDEYGAAHKYELPATMQYSFALAKNGDANNLTDNFVWYGTKQYWEDQNDSDYNDFVVNVWTQQVERGCN